MHVVHAYNRYMHNPSNSRYVNLKNQQKHKYAHIKTQTHKHTNKHVQIQTCTKTNMYKYKYKPVPTGSPLSKHSALVAPGMYW